MEALRVVSFEKYSHDLERVQESVPPRYQLVFQEVERIHDLCSDTIKQLEFIGCYGCWPVCCHLCCLLVLIELIIFNNSDSIL